MKKLFTFLLCLMIMLIPFKAQAKEKDKVTVYVFYGSSCPHCHAAFEFFDSIEEEYGKYFELKKFETWDPTIESKLDAKLMNKVHDELGPFEGNFGVPYIIIGDDVYVGYEEKLNDTLIDSIVSQYEAKNFSNSIVDSLVKAMIKEKNTIYGSFYGSLLVICVLLVLNEYVRVKEAYRK